MEPLPELLPLSCAPAASQAMLKYVDICVDMKAGRKCKDALINYRNACQQVRVRLLLRADGEALWHKAGRVRRCN